MTMWRWNVLSKGTTLAVTSSIKNGDDDGNLLTTTKFHSSVRCLLALLSTCYMLVHLLLIVASLILIASFYLLKFVSWWYKDFNLKFLNFIANDKCSIFATNLACRESFRSLNFEITVCFNNFALLYYNWKKDMEVVDFGHNEKVRCMY